MTFKYMLWDSGWEAWGRDTLYMQRGAFTTFNTKGATHTIKAFTNRTTGAIHNVKYQTKGITAAKQAAMLDVAWIVVVLSGKLCKYGDAGDGCNVG